MRSEDVQPLRIPTSGSERGPVAPARRTDELDRRIIEALQANGRESFRAIAARVGVSEATVRARYGRLTAEGILQVVAVTNPLGLGYEQALVGVKTSGSPEQAADAIARWPEADYVVATAGQFDLVVELVAADRRAAARADEPAARAAGRRLDRDFLVPGDVETALRLGEHAKGGNDQMSITRVQRRRRAPAAGERPPLAPLHAHGRPRSRRSSCAATAATSRTRTASATSTRSPGSSRSTSATDTAKRSGRRRSSRCVSCPSTRTGRTRTRARSSSRARSRRSPPATSTASSSSPAAPRPSSRRGSSRASTSQARGERRWKAIARDIAYHGTTFGALSINGIEPLRTPFEPLVPEVRHVSNTNRYHRPAEETEEEFTAFLLDELERTIQRDGARDGLPGPHGAGAERRRVVHRAGRLLAGRARALRPLRHPALGRRGDHRLRAGRRTGSAPSATTSGPTSSRARRVSRPPTPRSAPSSRPTA